MEATARTSIDLMARYRQDGRSDERVFDMVRSAVIVLHRYSEVDTDTVGRVIAELDKLVQFLKRRQDTDTLEFISDLLRLARAKIQLYCEARMTE